MESPSTPHEDDRPLRAAINLPNAVLLLGTVATVAVILATQAMGSVDGGWHLGAAADLLNYLTRPDSPARDYLEPRWYPEPNIAAQFPYTLLVWLFEPVVAEKVFLISYVVAMALAFRYAVRSVSPAAGWLTVFVVPLTVSLAFHWGLLNFVWSLIPFLVVTGYVLRHRGELTGVRAWILCGLLLVTYLTHLVSLVEAVLLITCVTVEDWWRAARRHDRVGPILIPRLAAIAPSLILAGVFLALNGTEGSDYRRAFMTLLLGLPSLAWPLVSFDRLEAIFTSLVGLTIGGLLLMALLARRRGAEHARVDSLMAFALAGTVAYLIAPEATGSGGLISERLALYPVIGVVLWLAGQRLPAWSPRVTAAAVGIAMVGLWVLRWPSISAIGRDTTDYLSVAPCMARDATVVQANLWYANRSPLGRIVPLVHDAGRLAAETGGHDLGSVLATLPLSPLKYRADLDPFTYLFTGPNGDYSIPPLLSPLGYEATTDGRVDYVVLFGRVNASGDTLSDPQWLAVADELARGYRLVGRSSSGVVELYERNDSPVATAGASRRAEPAAAGCAVAEEGQSLAAGGPESR